MTKRELLIMHVVASRKQAKITDELFDVSAGLGDLVADVTDDIGCWGDRVVEYLLDDTEKLDWYFEAVFDDVIPPEAVADGVLA